ncbi:hypothetical protein GQ53DRAFT_170502 [Thozetella sp. PMI_491]|nr:hypothetical protein GQ53DRAFT_170502 [Thozetella sp. PMI_491]
MVTPLELCGFEAGLAIGFDIFGFSSQSIPFSQQEQINCSDPSNTSPVHPTSFDEYQSPSAFLSDFSEDDNLEYAEPETLHQQEIITDPNDFSIHPGHLRPVPNFSAYTPLSEKDPAKHDNCYRYHGIGTSDSHASIDPRLLGCPILTLEATSEAVASDPSTQSTDPQEAILTAPTQSAEASHLRNEYSFHSPGYSMASGGAKVTLHGKRTLSKTDASPSSSKHRRVEDIGVINKDTAILRLPCTKPPCTSTFLTRRDLDRHIATVHKKLKLECPLCRKQFASRIDNLNRHMKTTCRNRPQ